MLNKKLLVLGSLLAASTLGFQPNVNANYQEQIDGFIASQVASELELEEKYRALLTTDYAMAWLERMSSRPNHLGSAFGKENADFVADQFRSWGYQVEVAEYQVLFPTPKVRELSLLEPTQYTAGLAEVAVEGDQSTDQLEQGLPPYVAYGADGDVTAEVVFVNRGVPADYEILKQNGISVEGKIVIAKFGGSWRGIKPKVAAENGAIGTLIYSDPADDGYGPGDVYPDGPYKNAYGVQRGSIMDLPVRTGDPLTPYVGATPDAERLDISEAETLMTIPVLPISYTDALPILSALSGPEVPVEWRGGLPITYKMGPGPAKVNLKVEYNWDTVTAYNVIATLPGDEMPDEWIMRGNHRDAWVHGAADPLSGHVSMMEEARALGVLYNQGWRPKRTIKFMSWDGEEQGLLGSTEWVEDHAEELREKAAVYVNTDGNGRGFLFVAGAPSLEKMFEAVAFSVTDPQTGVSVAERRRAGSRVIASGAEKKYAQEDGHFHIDGMGAGSDYGPFYQHLGIPALHIQYAGEDPSGSYHTNYDTFAHYTRFVDPGLAYNKALAETTGLTTLRLANATYLPFDYSRSYRTFMQYAEELVDLTDRMREETKEHNALVEKGAFTLAADPTETYVAPEAYELVPYLNFAPLLNAIEGLDGTAKELENVLAPIMAEDVTFAPETLAHANDLLSRIERTLTPEHGLINRPWYRHHIDAPGLYTGYGVKTMPAVREAIEQRRWVEADEQIALLAELINDYSDAVKRAAQALETD